MEFTKMKRVMAGFIVLCVLLTTLIGCGGERSVPANTEETKKTEDVTVEEEPKEQHVSFWTVVPIQSQWDQMAEVLKEKMPNLKVDYLHIGNADEYRKKIQVGLAGGEGPDMLTIYKAEVEQFDKFLENIKPIADKNWGSGWEDKFIPDAITGTTSKAGNQIGIPINVVAQEFVLYNKTLMAELGVTNFEPKTYDEFKAVCDQISAKGVVPVVFGAKDGWHAGDVFVYLANQVAPGKVYEAQAGNVKWTDPAFVETMQLYKKLFDEIFQKGAAGLSTYPDARDQYYYSRKAAMFLTGSWHVGSYCMPGGEKWGTTIEKDETGAFMLPQMGANEAKVTTYIGEILAINKTAKDKDAAWKLFDFMTMGEGAQTFADLLQGSPVRKDIKITSLDKIPTQSDRESVEKLLKVLPNSGGEMRFNYPELQDAIGIAIQEMSVGKDIMKVLEDVQKVSEKIKR